MKKGFALLETLVVITFLCVSMLMLYGTFSSMARNSKNNLLYDDAANIYDVNFLKEYLKENGLNDVINSDFNIKILNCNDFGNSCDTLVKKMDIKDIYLIKYDLREVDNNSMLTNYLKSLSNKDNYKYRLVAEFEHAETYKYASIGVGEENE